MKWPIVELGEVAASVDYGLTASADPQPVGPKFLRITDIQDDHVDWTLVPYCAASKKEEATNSLASGDIVFARTGATTGKSFLIRSCPASAVFASYLIRVRPSQRVNSTYLAHFFRSEDYWMQIRKSARGAAQPGVNSTVLKQLSVPLPPLDEQRRIAVILDQADDLRRKRREALGRVDSFTQSVFLKMFGDWSNPGFNGKLEPIGAKLDFLTSGSRGWAEYYRESGDLFLRIQNVKNDELDLEDVAYVDPPQTAEAKRTRVEAGDVLLSITADLGRTAVVPKGIGSAFINQHLAILRTSAYEPRYLSAAIASRAGQAAIQRKNREGVKAGLNFDDVRSLEIPAASRAEQRKFAAIAAESDKLKAHHRAHLARLDAMFGSLQYRVFNGEL